MIRGSVLAICRSFVSCSSTPCTVCVRPFAYHPAPARAKPTGENRVPAYATCARLRRYRLHRSLAQGSYMWAQTVSSSCGGDVRFLALRSFKSSTSNLKFCRCPRGSWSSGDHEKLLGIVLSYVLARVQALHRLPPPLEPSCSDCSYKSGHTVVSSDLIVVNRSQASTTVVESTREYPATRGCST